VAGGRPSPKGGIADTFGAISLLSGGGMLHFWGVIPILASVEARRVRLDFEVLAPAPVHNFLQLVASS
jgi:hypothetical protein